MKTAASVLPAALIAWYSITAHAQQVIMFSSDATPVHAQQLTDNQWEERGNADMVFRASREGSFPNGAGWSGGNSTGGEVRAATDAFPAQPAGQFS